MAAYLGEKSLSLSGANTSAALARNCTMLSLSCSSYSIATCFIGASTAASAAATTAFCSLSSPSSSSSSAKKALRATAARVL